MRRPLHPDVLSLIEQHIRSLVQLDVLLYMRAHGSSPLTADAVARELRMPPEPVAAHLADAVERGFLLAGPDGTYLYAPAPYDRARLDRAATAFAQQRVSLIEAIFSVPSETIQSFPVPPRPPKTD